MVAVLPPPIVPAHVVSGSTVPPSSHDLVQKVEIQTCFAPLYRLSLVSFPATGFVIIPISETVEGYEFTVTPPSSYV